MAANRLPLIFREEKVNLSDGSYDIPDGVIGVVIEMKAGGNSGSVSVSFYNPTFSITNGMYRGGGGGHHYETINCYNIFLPNRYSDLLPRQVIVAGSGSTVTKVIRWIYAL